MALNYHHEGRGKHRFIKVQKVFGVGGDPLLPYDSPAGADIVNIYRPNLCRTIACLNLLKAR